MSEHRNSSPYSQRRAQTYDTHAGGSSGDPYDGVEVSQPNAKQTMANRAQSVRDSSKYCHGAAVGPEVSMTLYQPACLVPRLTTRSNKRSNHG
jgi:hypothetical protein